MDIQSNPTCVKSVLFQIWVLKQTLSVKLRLSDHGVNSVGTHTVYCLSKLKWKQVCIFDRTGFLRKEKLKKVACSPCLLRVEQVCLVIITAPHVQDSW